MTRWTPRITFWWWATSVWEIFWDQHPTPMKMASTTTRTIVLMPRIQGKLISMATGLATRAAMPTATG